MKKYLSESNQQDILFTMKQLIDSIRSCRVEVGVEHPQHDEIWVKIENSYNRLDYKYQDEFNNYLF